MTITPTYPGVYVTEVPSGNRTVTGVATAITAFVGVALRGPVDDPVPISNFSEFERSFGGLWRSSGLGYAVRDFYLNGGGQALVVRVTHDDADTARLAVGTLQLEATGPGAWANTLEVVVEHPAAADAADIAAGQGGGVEADDLFTLTVRDGAGDGATVEVYRNVTMVDGPQRVDRLLESSQLVRASATPSGARPPDGTTTVAVADRARTVARSTPTTTPGPTSTATSAGSTHWRRPTSSTCSACRRRHPGASFPPTCGRRRAAYAVTRRAFLVVDPPPVLTVDDAATWAADNGLTGARRSATRRSTSPASSAPTRCAAGRCDTFAPCGAVAGVIARTDAQRGVWKAPAGIEAGLTGVRRPRASTLTDDENGSSTRSASTACAPSRASGTVVWGARTLRGADALADEYKYVPVRRLALFIEESLYRGTAVGGVRAQRRAAVGADPAQRRRLHAGPVPPGRLPGHDARATRTSCKCDAETTTQNDIDRGIVNILVGFAPLKPAEFVIIQHPADGRPDRPTVVGGHAHGRSSRVNATRFDPYKNFKFRVKWDGRYVAGISKVSALKRTTEVVKHREGGDPSTSRKSPGPHRVRGDHARARRHPRHGVRAVGQQGLELRLRARRGGLAEGLPQGHHHRALQRGRAARASPTRSTAAGSRSSRRCPISTPTPTPSRSRHQAGERGLGARLRRHRADRAVLRRAVTRCTTATTP